MTAETEADRSPKHGASAFECPYCGVYAVQSWAEVKGWGATNKALFWKWSWSECCHCHHAALWTHDKRLIWPESAKLGPKPNGDMPEPVRAIYEEAQAVLSVSPRSAAALLRLALQTLIDTLEPGSKSINEKIRRLVARGLEPTARKAMDVLRIVGNNAVHPGEILLDDDSETVPALFALLNLVVHHVLSRPRQVDSLFDSLPESAKSAIERRDADNVVDIKKSTGNGSAKKDSAVKKNAAGS